MQIHLSETLRLPAIEFASQGNAILGIRDSGKSYTATYLAEQLLTAGIPFVALDPIGVWKYLKQGAGGKKGFDIVVAASRGGDVTLTPENAAALVRAAMKQNIPLILDLYSIELTKADWRRIVEAAVKVLLYENGEHGLRHIFIEEAAEFVPQRIGSEQARVYSVIESLARMGGNAKLGYTLINQRAEEVNKAVLELCDCLFLHRQKGRRSLESLGKWLDFSQAGESKKIISSIATAGTGEVWVWPRSTETPVHVQKIPAKRTFHPDRRALSGSVATPLPKVDSALLARLRESLAVEEEEAPASDSSRKAAGRIPAVPVLVEPEIRYVFREGELAKLDAISREMLDLQHRFETTAGELLAAVREADRIGPKPAPAPAPRSAPAPRPTTPAPARPASNGARLGQGPQALLAVAAAFHPDDLTTYQLGTLSGYTPSTVRTYLPQLVRVGYMEHAPKGERITAAGLKLFPNRPSRPSKAQVREMWFKQLPAGERQILECLCNMGRSISMDTLAQQTGYTSSTLRTYIPKLRNNRLIDRHELKASPEFLG